MSGRRRSSFYWALRLMAPARRRAMFAIFDYCRGLDDIADGNAPAAEKASALAEWRAAVLGLFAGRNVGIVPVAALAEARERFGLEREPLLALIDGMEMDISGVAAPDARTFTLYCDRVAGAVGLLAVRVFGSDGPRDRAFAVALAEGMQRVNMLRDIAEDAERGRLYLPREDLIASGLDPERTIPDLVSSPEFGQAVARFAARTRTRMDAAAATVPELPACLWPACAMMAVYRRLLLRLEAAGWPRGTVRVPARERFWLALRHLGPRTFWPRSA